MCAWVGNVSTCVILSRVPALRITGFVRLYIGVNVRRRLRIESYYFSRTEALKRARDRCVPMHRVCSTRPGTFCVPFTDSDKELYLNQQHVTSRSWMEWRNRRSVLSRFIRIRGMRYRNCITEGHTLLFLFDVARYYSIFQLGKHAFNDTKVSSTSTITRIIFFHSLFSQLCENYVL